MEGTTCLLDRVSDQIKYQNAESGLSFSSEPRVFGRTSTECFEERTGSVSLPGLDTSPPCEIEPQLEGPLDESVDDEIYNFDSLADLEVPLTAKAKVEHATSELFLVARLAVRLWSYLGLGIPNHLLTARSFLFRLEMDLKLLSFDGVLDNSLTGLHSSNICFVLFLREVVFRWDFIISSLLKSKEA